MHPIVDGDKHHHSKLVSYGERSLEKAIASVNVKNYRMKALALTAKINARSIEHSNKKTNEMMTEIEKLISERKKN